MGNSDSEKTPITELVGKRNHARKKAILFCDKCYKMDLIT